MPYCAKCGTEISFDAQYCPTCGAPVKKETSSMSTVSLRPSSVSRNLFDRMICAARLDASLYEEVEKDETATTQAFLVIILSSVCSGIGTAIDKAIAGVGSGGIGIGLFGGLFSALIVWVVWSFITYFVGTKFFGGTASFGELLRTIGFADSPEVLLFFSFIPILGGLLSFGVWVWGLVAMVVAVRQALDFSTGKAILTCIVGWITALVLLVIIGFLFALPFLFLGVSSDLQLI